MRQQQTFNSDEHNTITGLRTSNPRDAPRAQTAPPTASEASGGQLGGEKLDLLSFDLTVGFVLLRWFKRLLLRCFPRYSCTRPTRIVAKVKQSVLTVPGSQVPLSMSTFQPSGRRTNTSVLPVVTLTTIAGHLAKSGKLSLSPTGHDSCQPDATAAWAQLLLRRLRS